MLPREPGEFRVVVTFHHGDGALCQAELRPAEASELVAEIARAIDQGNAIGAGAERPS